MSNFEKRGPKSYGNNQSSGGNFGKQQRSYSSPAGAGDANRGPKKWDSSAKSSSNNRPAYGQDKPYGSRPARPANNSAKNLLRDVLNSEKPKADYGDRPRRDWNQGAKPYQQRPAQNRDDRGGYGGDRPQRPSYNENGDRPSRPYGNDRGSDRPQRPYNNDRGGDGSGDRSSRPYNDNRGGNQAERPSYGGVGGYRRPSDNGRGSDRPQRPYDNDRGGDRPARPAQEESQRPLRSSNREGRDKRARTFDVEPRDDQRPSRESDTRPERPYQREGGDRPQRSFNRDDRGSERSGDRPQRDRSNDRGSDRNDRLDNQEEAERLHKYLARCGVASRRAAEMLISEGRVEVNGELVMEMGYKVKIGDEVRLDMNKVVPEKPHYVLLYKPKGVITTMSDPQGRRTIVDLLPDVGVMLRPVGRLDKETEGVIICTNDGNLTDRLTHPKFGVEKEYHVIVRGDVSEKAVDRLRKGVNILGRYTEPAFVEKVSYEKRADTTKLIMVIHEGRNRQIRLMCDAVGHPVDALERVRIGPLTGRGLQAGQARRISQTELDQLYAMSGPEVERSYIPKVKQPEYRARPYDNARGNDERPRQSEGERGDNRERGSSERGGYGRSSSERPYWERSQNNRENPSRPSGGSGRRDQRPGYDRSARPAGNRESGGSSYRGPSGGDRPVRKSYRKD